MTTPAPLPTTPQAAGATTPGCPPARGSVPRRALVLGAAVTGCAVARALLARGHAVVVADDHPDAGARAAISALGLELVVAPTPERLERLVATSDVVLPAPGVPAHHPVFAFAIRRGVPVWSEFELAARWSDLELVAITGTNGKTTVTTLVTEMLQRSGRATVAAGNTDLPLVDALDRGLDVVVVEASSSRLALTESFRARVAAWLNLSQDHLDWHGSMAGYESAKARIWAHRGPGDIAIANADDAVVAAAARRLDGAVAWFSLAGDTDWRWDRGSGVLAGPGGPLIAVSELPRRLPHDLANALAAAATATASGATPEVCATVLAGFTGLAHRMRLVAVAGGISWYDDSKATTPASVLAAVAGFPSVVLVAGGRNKGLDLSALTAAVPPVHAVVAIGEATAEVIGAFGATGVPVRAAASMAEAVHSAAGLARAGDAVLLSPGCASYDWYHDYGQRGDDFTRLVLAGPAARRRTTRPPEATL